MFRSPISVAFTFGFYPPFETSGLGGFDEDAPLANPGAMFASPLDEAFEADIDCTDCGHRQHVGECVAGIWSVCGCDHPSWPAIAQPWDQACAFRGCTNTSFEDTFCAAHELCDCGKPQAHNGFCDPVWD